MLKLKIALIFIIVSLFCFGQAAKEGYDPYSIENWDSLISTVIPKKEALKQPSDACATYITYVNDRITGNVSINSVGVLGLNNNTSLTFYQFNNGEAILNFNLDDIGCVDDHPTLYVLFKDGSRTEIRSFDKFNCDETISFSIGGIYGYKDELEQLKLKDVEAFRVYVRDVFLTDSLSVRINNIISCLIP